MASNTNPMRQMRTFLLMVVPLMLIATACEKAVDDPDVCYTLTIKKDLETITLTEPYTVDAGRAIVFDNCGMADFYSYFSGEPGHIYTEFIDPSDLTTVGADTQAGGNLTYTYQTPGQYVFTMLLTNREVGNPGNFNQVSVDFVFTVTEPEED